MPIQFKETTEGFIPLLDSLAAKVSINKRHIIESGLNIVDPDYARHTCIRCTIESIIDINTKEVVESGRLVINNKVTICIPGSKLFDEINFYKTFAAVYWYNFIADDTYTGQIYHYNLDGSLARVISMRDGKKNGMERKYVLNKNGIVTISEETQYLDDLVDGFKKSYYENGMLYYTREYKQGVRDGESIEFDDKGNKISYCVYKRGKKHGREELYREDATLKSVHNYINGLKEGDQFYYKKDGHTIQCHAIFANNTLYDIVKGYLNTSDY